MNLNTNNIVSGAVVSKKLLGQNFADKHQGVYTGGHSDKHSASALVRFKKELAEWRKRDQEENELALKALITLSITNTDGLASVYSSIESDDSIPEDLKASFLASLKSEIKDMARVDFHQGLDLNTLIELAEKFPSLKPLVATRRAQLNKLAARAGISREASASLSGAEISRLTNNASKAQNSKIENPKTLNPHEFDSTLVASSQLPAGREYDPWGVKVIAQA